MFVSFILLRYATRHTEPSSLVLYLNYYNYSLRRVRHFFKQHQENLNAGAAWGNSPRKTGGIAIAVSYFVFPICNIGNCISYLQMTKIHNVIKQSSNVLRAENYYSAADCFSPFYTSIAWIF